MARRQNNECKMPIIKVKFLFHLFELKLLQRFPSSNAPRLFIFTVVFSTVNCK